jgi:hypothetical protein
VTFGSPEDDTIAGDAADNWLFGGPGDDVLDGGAGLNTLEGDAGIDSSLRAQFFVSCENQSEGTVGPSEEKEPPTEPAPVS